ncbi:MAG TPA: ABC transporter permease [Hyphomicrobiaceae bacterium]|nr:ABC transporter permease [Hyphomicrobiaceae bacterium]
MSQQQKAADDLIAGVGLFRYWAHLAWHEIKVRYRGSLIGPFWITLSLALMIAGLGLLYSQLFRQDIATYIPFLAFGLVLWTLVAGTLTDACHAFVANAGTIKQMKVPFSAHVLQTVFRNLIVLVHNAVILAGIVVLFDVPAGVTSLTAVPGFVVLVANLAWMSLFLAVVCARFRDVGQIVASLLQIAFFLSPILWDRSMLRGHTWLADYNPFYALIDIVRAPLIGATAAEWSWPMALGMLGIGAVGSFLVFRRSRSRIVYWI